MQKRSCGPHEILPEATKKGFTSGILEWFEFKTIPHDKARAPNSREWRKWGEGLDIGCVAKGKKEGSANFIIAISYGKGVVLCEGMRAR